ncbi:SDR family NAD(P)-dependent oxidoreductase [Lentzea sp. NPDC051838]|uniref:SDR family NAD(P)-dependent oxidoreductase n=1 Tax=Lentzea sp. NPDC051838 TaxID=3154849 RepID=UPI0034154C94
MARKAVITAGTGGIGLETALGLAKAGYAVTVVGRNASRGAQAVDRLNAGGGEPARFLQADLSSLAEVRALGERIAAEGELAVLVNNVGAMFEDRTELDGVEASFVVNHLSPALLTELLLPALKAGTPSRVVNVTTGAVVLAKKTFDHAEPPGGYYGFHWYGRAKLANLAHTLDLAARLRGSGVSVHAADPGGAATDMTDGTMRKSKIVSPALRLLWPLVRRKFERSTAGAASDAAKSSIIAATDHTLPTGQLIGPQGTPVPPVAAATDPRVITAVRRLTDQHLTHTPVPDGVSN